MVSSIVDLAEMYLKFFMTNRRCSFNLSPLFTIIPEENHKSGKTDVRKYMKAVLEHSKL